MNVAITHRHASSNAEVDAFIRSKVERISRFFDHIQTVNVILEGENGTHAVEMTMVVDRGPTFVAHGEGTSWFDSVSQAEGKLEAQIKKHKERLISKHHGR